MRKHVVVAGVAVLLVAGCTDAGEPDVSTTTEAATGTVETDAGTGTDLPTATTDTATATDAPTGAATATGTGAAATGEATAGGPTTGEAVRTECETAVVEAGGLEDLRNVERLRPVFDACNSIEDFTAAVESQLEGFEDVDLEPYVETGCTFARELSGTRLCQAM